MLFRSRRRMAEYYRLCSSDVLEDLAKKAEAKAAKVAEAAARAKAERAKGKKIEQENADRVKAAKEKAGGSKP